MTDLAVVFNIYFVSAISLFFRFFETLMVAGLFAILMRGFGRLLL